VGKIVEIPNPLIYVRARLAEEQALGEVAGGEFEFFALVPVSVLVFLPAFLPFGIACQRIKRSRSSAFGPSRVGCGLNQRSSQS
jgi:hypothetical protein